MSRAMSSAAAAVASGTGLLLVSALRALRPPCGVPGKGRFGAIVANGYSDAWAGHAVAHNTKHQAVKLKSCKSAILMLVTLVTFEV